MVINKQTLNSGDIIKCKISSKTVIGRIYINGDRFYICHNDSDFIGSNPPEMYGYKYAWVNDCDVSNVELLYSSPETSVKIDSEILRFSSIFNYSDIFSIFSCILFNNFNDIKISETKGMIILSDGKKKVEMRISRFVKQLFSTTDQNKIDIIKKISTVEITDSYIEKLYNRYVSFQNKSLFELKILSGEDILKGYTVSNYLEGYPKSVLGQSCMNDKHSYLSIYTQNKNIQLATLWSEDKLISRSILWKLTDGRLVNDRIYYLSDWMLPLMKEQLKKIDVTYDLTENSDIVEVSLDNSKFAEYPYLDSLFYLDTNTNIITNRRVYDRKVLRRTDGQYSIQNIEFLS